MRAKQKSLAKRSAKTAKPSGLAKFNGGAQPKRPIVPLKERRLNFGSRWDYAPAPETFEYIKVAPRQQLYIDGKFVRPSTGKYFDSLNPATEEKLTEIALAGEQDVDIAVQAARRAYENVWSKLSGR